MKFVAAPDSPSATAFNSSNYQDCECYYYSVALADVTQTAVGTQIGCYAGKLVVQAEEQAAVLENDRSLTALTQVVVILVWRITAGAETVLEHPPYLVTLSNALEAAVDHHHMVIPKGGSSG